MHHRHLMHNPCEYGSDTQLIAEQMAIEANHRCIYVGDLNDASNVSFLRKHNISAMLSAVQGAIGDYGDVVKAVNKVGIAHQHVDVGDAPQWSLVPHFETIRTFLDSHQRVLVHCVSGVSRSASCVLAYMVMTASRLDEAYEKLLAVYAKASPAPWFMAELRALDVAHGVFPRHDALDAPLFLRAAAVGIPLKPYSNCNCPPIRCRKCRNSVMGSCLPFGSIDRASLLLAHTVGLHIGGDSIICQKCGSKIGALNPATWIDGVNAGIGSVSVYRVEASRVDFPLGMPWPSLHVGVKLGQSWH